MGSILPFIPVNFFDPEMTRLMSAALDSAWEQLQSAGHVETMPFRADVTRERMASAIIEQARKGVTDPGKLTGAALSVILSERRVRAARAAIRQDQPLAS
jgi:hypothetical protein